MGLLKNIFGEKEENKEQIENSQPAEPKKENGEDITAIIAATIHLYLQEVHDFENYCLTIKRIDRIYSPWSSKIYGLRKSPRYN